MQTTTIIMIPRFQNPHLLTESIAHTTRAKLFNDDGENGRLDVLGQTTRLRHLDKLLRDCIGEISPYQASAARKRKREQQDVSQDAPCKYELFLNLHY